MLWQCVHEFLGVVTHPRIAVLEAARGTKHPSLARALTGLGQLAMMEGHRERLLFQ
jgi:hypothetical protein